MALFCPIRSVQVCLPCTPLPTRQHVMTRGKTGQGLYGHTHKPQNTNNLNLYTDQQEKEENTFAYLL